MAELTHPLAHTTALTPALPLAGLAAGLALTFFSMAGLPRNAAADDGSGQAWTGGLSEEEFKALHELRKDGVPPLIGSPVEIAGATCYLSLPQTAKAPIPGIVVIHEWWGLNDHIRHWADRLAADGYASLAVDLYGGQVADSPDSAMAFMKAVDEGKAMEILQAAEMFLREDPRVKAQKVGSIGWCFGGGYSLRLALAAPGQDATVLYYGRLVTDPEQLRAIHGPVLGVFGNLDQSVPPAAVDEFDRALKEAKVPHTILRYDAVHAFANPSNPKYDQKAAADAWEKVRSFFKKHLKDRK